MSKKQHALDPDDQALVDRMNASTDRAVAAIERCTDVETLASIDVGKVSADDPEPRPFDIAGIPQTISRADCNALIESLGIDIRWLMSLRFGLKGIEAEVVALNAEGKPYVANYGDGKAATHVVTIPIVD